MERIEFLNGIEDIMLGSSVFIAFGANFSNAFHIINTCHPNCPKLTEDWLMFNHMLNLADVTVTTVLFT
jgi:hypothetical protein